jgi:hypothetical protein
MVSRISLLGESLKIKFSNEFVLKMMMMMDIPCQL